MKDSRVLAIVYRGVGYLRAWAYTVSDAMRSNNEPAQNPGKYGAINEPLVKDKPVRRPLYLISKHENGQTEIFTIPGSGRETLPIFSHEEEAEMFLLLGAPGAYWRARETTAEELISLLCGPCVGVRRVALDPLPLLDDAAMGGLVSLLREDFLRNLVDEREPRAPWQGSFGPEAAAGSGLSENARRRRA